MLVAPKYTGIEIPVLPFNTEVIDDVESNRFCQSQDRIVRACVVSQDMGNYFDSLAEYLEVADQELQNAAKACGAIAIPHAWGLYELGPQTNPDLAVFLDSHDHNGGCPLSPILPEDHILVSEVPVVREASSQLNILDLLNVIDGIEEYHNSKKTGEYIFADNNQDQYVSGIIPSEGFHKRSLWLIDIEPEIGLK